MDNQKIILLYIKKLIQPLEQTIKSPYFVKKYSKTQQEQIELKLLQHYKAIEKMIKEQLF